MGKAVLAEFTESELMAYLNRVELKAIARNTITERSVLLNQLADIKRKGYAVDDSEGEDDVYCLGVSLYLNGESYGAFSISVPFYRISADIEREIVHAILKTKSNILRELQQNNVFI